MTLNKGERIKLVLEELASHSSMNVGKCMITNERGLVIADYGSETTGNSFPAMLSLIAATGYRASESIGLKRSDAVVLFSGSEYLVVRSFDVRGKQFQLGILFSQKLTKRILRKKPFIADSVKELDAVTKKARMILEA